MVTELIGSRVRLVPVGHDDVQSLFEIARNPSSIEDYQRAAMSPSDVLSWLSPALAGDEIAWTIRVDERIVGLVSLEPGESATEAEIGYFVDVEHAGNGFAGDAVDTVVDWALTTQCFDKITAGISLRNPASVRVIEKAGFVHTMTVERDWEWDGQWWDSAYYERNRT